MPELFRLQTLESVNVIELDLPEILDTVEFDSLNDHMLTVIEGKTGQPWVLDLAAVSYMGSAMLGLIVNIRQRVKGAGGRLVLCNVSSRLLDIFRTCSMERLFTIVKARPDAIKALAP